MAGDLSAHLSRSEMRCKCGCGRVVVSAKLPPAFERMRAAGYPGGLVIASGYRCEKHNADVGGVPGSKHRTGEAIDPRDPRMTLDEVKGLQVFTGIGWRWHVVGGRRLRLVEHVDVGHRPGHDVTHPATWEYLPDGSRR